MIALSAWVGVTHLASFGIGVALTYRLWVKPAKEEIEDLEKETKKLKKEKK